MDRKIQRRRRVWRIVHATVLAQLCCVTILTSQNFAQPGGGGGGGGGGWGRGGGRGFRGFPTPEETFSRVDTDGDGRASSDEINADRMTSRMFGDVDTSQGLSRDEFIRESERIRENFFQRMRNGGGGRGGFGGGGREGRGGRGGNDSERRRDGGERDRSRDGGSRDASANAESGNSQNGNSDSGTTNTGAASNGNASAKPTGPKSRPRVTVDLQPDLVSGDTDHDGQIGLYEWRRFAGHTLKEFKELDRNQDGFVTPAEVAYARPAEAAAPAASGGTIPAPTNPSAGADTPASTAASPRPSAAPNNEQAARDAKTFFRLLDKNRDGQIAADEWQNGKTKTLFTKNNVDLAQPMSEDVFSGHYLRLSAAPSGG